MLEFCIEKDDPKEPWMKEKMPADLEALWTEFGGPDVRRARRRRRRHRRRTRGATLRAAGDADAGPSPRARSRTTRT